ncbi:3D domain-containing protein [Paenibacillus bouchesdurhonensis]|uniref:3D domain-containing protein n=1 Tax=Paenibacillus bouchesdurhonensis TaxID=1870990 RepID=UPI000DA62D3E|nr:3D domain-containing protein [Paenibacillus bouchesdurhonensis]
MGIFQKEETHESRSSSMSYALRWKHENLRQISVVTLLTVAAIFVILIWLNGNSKNIYLVVDGQIQEIETRKSLVNQVLDEQSIVLSQGDTISRSLESSLKEGDRIVIVRAVPVQVSVDGATKSHLTTQSSVQGIINELGIKVNPDDKVTPELSSKVTSDLKISVVRVAKHTVQTKETVPFNVVKTSDPNLEKGQTKVLQQGNEGVVVHHVEKVYEDGHFVSKRWLSKEIETKAQDKVVAVGTKPKPEAVLAANITRTADQVDISGTTTKGGVSFKYKKVLKNVTLTAYSAEEDGIGTKTASGTRVTEGRTIAVDKSVVPMGWWVYIEGIGFRRAEDTGGAIKGNKMDVYFDSLKTAKNFGRKKGRTVYVIGPNKPELN